MAGRPCASKPALAPKPLLSIFSVNQVTPSGEREAYSELFAPASGSRLISVRKTARRRPCLEIASVGSRPTGRPSMGCAMVRTRQRPSSRRSA